jgi:hypothetical protein
MVSSHQFHTWEQGPLLLSIRFHVLFSPIPYMKKGTPLSIYNTMRVLHGLMYGIGKRPWCCIERQWFMVSWFEEARDHGVVYRQIEWSVVSCVYTTPWSLFHQVHTWDHTVFVDHSICLYNTMIFLHQFQTCWPWTTISVYTASWSLLTNSIHENRGHSFCLYDSK